MISQQTALDSPFGYRSSAQEVVADVDLSGKTAVVTGGYSGIGTETVKALAGAGAKVIVAARRPEVAQENLADVEGSVSIVALDLGKPDSIDAFVQEVSEQNDEIHLLINNAAIMANPLTRDDRGYESQFATNHLGHFQLTAGLWPLLEKAENARVVALSSSAHRINGIDLDDPNFDKREYNKWTAYGQAKSANALFALKLDKLGEPKGVRAFAVDPGGIKTPLQRHLTMEEQIAMGWFDKDGNPHEMFKTTEQGASTTVWAATSPQLEGKGGVFCANCNISEPWKEGDMPFMGVHAHVRDEKLADDLWAKSEELIGRKFPA
ncbi:MAG: oxidoreductase [Bacteroidota bacterium]